MSLLQMTDSAPLSWPFPAPVARMWGQRLAKVAAQLTQNLVSLEIPEILRTLLFVTLHQPGKLLASPVAHGKPLRRADGALWALHAILAHSSIVGADRIDAPQALWESAIPVAVAVEFLGTALDIFDDVQDGDGELLGSYSAPMLINAGMALRELAQLALDDVRLSPPLQVALHHVFASDTLRSIGGQTLDIAFEQVPQVSPDEALEMTERKSGSLVGLVYRVGALTGVYQAEQPAQAQTIGERFAQMGRNLGVILQLENDLNDARSKARKNDRQRHKKTLPLVLEAQKALQTSKTKRAHFVSDAIRAAIGIFSFRARTQLEELVALHGISPSWLQWMVDN